MGAGEGKDPSIIAGHFETFEDDRALSSPTFIVPSQSEISRTKVLGHRFLYLAHWVTNLKPDFLLSNLAMVRIKDPFYFSWSIADFPRISAKRATVSPYFDEVHKLRLHNAETLISGPHLRIALSTPCESCADGPLVSAGRTTANLIRIQLGLAAASTLSLESVCDTEKMKSKITGLEQYIWPEFVASGHDRSAFANFLGELPSQGIHITRDVELIFTAAMDAVNPTQRLLFLWFAIETLVGSEGAERKNFCLNSLASEAVNAEMRQLHGIRVRLAHYGSSEACSNDAISALWLFRICLLPQGALRKSLVAGYEHWIRTRSK